MNVSDKKQRCGRPKGLYILALPASVKLICRNWDIYRHILQFLSIPRAVSLDDDDLVHSRFMNYQDEKFRKQVHEHKSLMMKYSNHSTHIIL
jgi:hypothetical protein